MLGCFLIVPLFALHTFLETPDEPVSRDCDVMLRNARALICPQQLNMSSSACLSILTLCNGHSNEAYQSLLARGTTST